MKRKMAYIGISYAAAMFVASFLSLKTSFIISAAVLCASAALFFILKARRAAILTVCISIAAAFAANALYICFQKSPVLSLSGKQITMKGSVTDFTYYSSDTMRLEVSGEIDGTDCEVSFLTDAYDVDYYDKVKISGTVNEIQNTVDFDSKNYYSSKGIYLEGSDVTNIEITPISFSFKRMILNYRDFLFDKITSFLPSDAGGFLGAMLCSDKSQLDSSTKQTLYRSGLGHIFALSGTHLVIVTSLIYSILSLIIKNRKLVSAVTLISTAAFVIFAGASVSVLRAALMSSLIYSSWFFDRRPDPLNSLGLSAAIILIFSPYAVRNVSFILSFAGALAVSVVSPLILKSFSGHRFLKLLSVITPSTAASLVTIPISLFYFNEVSLIAPITNILLIPLCTLSLAITIIIALTAGFSLIANPLLFVASMLVNVVLKISELLSKLPFAYVGTGNAFLNILICAFCVSVLFILIKAKSLSRALTGSYSVLSIAFSISILSKALFSSNPSLYYIANNSGSALVLVNSQYAAVFDISGKNGSANAVNDLLEQSSVKSTDLFLCKNPSHSEAYYKENLSTKILSCESISQSDITIASLGLQASENNGVLTVRYDGKSYTFHENAKISHDDELSKYYSLQNGVKYDILNEKRIF